MRGIEEIRETLIQRIAAPVNKNRRDNVPPIRLGKGINRGRAFRPLRLGGQLQGHADPTG